MLPSVVRGSTNLAGPRTTASSTPDNSQATTIMDADDKKKQLMIQHANMVMRIQGAFGNLVMMQDTFMNKM
jgi:hypothetical protein